MELPINSKINGMEITLMSIQKNELNLKILTIHHQIKNINYCLKPKSIKAN